MIGWILAALGAACVASSVSEKNRQIRDLKEENECLKLTFYNQSKLLRDYDYVNRYAKSLNYHGAVDFFYYLADAHDSRFEHFARFLNKVRHIRNKVAHEGETYIIDSAFLNKLEACRYICDEYRRLPYGRRLYLN